VKGLGGEVVAVGMEEKNADELRKTIQRAKAPFPILDGAGGKWRERYEYLYVYVIDAKGVVRSIFASTVHARPRGEAVVGAFERMMAPRPETGK
jgi:hypothetical protein